MKIYKSLHELIGRTPLIELCGIEKKYDLKSVLLAKAEAFNPGGSIKDRAVLSMIEEAERTGELLPNGTIIEPTSGNTGIGISMIAAIKGYRAIIVMPDTMSVERCKLVKAYGAGLVLTDGKKGMRGAIEKAEQLHAEIKGSIIAGQFYNPANAAAHRKTTGVELWNDTDGNIAALIAGVGSGGTITGTGEYLKSKNPDIRIVAVEPDGSPFLSKGVGGAHKIQGIGAGFIPQLLNIDIIDEIITVTDSDAFHFCHEAAKNDGMLVGISSGAALCAAVELAQREEYFGKTIAVILPDGGERYLSTPLFDE